MLKFVISILASKYARFFGRGNMCIVSLVSLVSPRLFQPRAAPAEIFKRGNAKSTLLCNKSDRLSSAFAENLLFPPSLPPPSRHENTFN